MARLTRWFRAVTCTHRREMQAHLLGTTAKVRYCPGCSRVRWVD